MPYRFSRFLSQQLDAMNDALIPLALAVLATAVVVWLLTRWRYRRRLALLEAELAEREAMAATTWNSVAATASVPADDTDAGVRDENRARRKALRAMTNAVDGAELALRGGGADQIEGAMPGMWLALATARSTFELPIPAQEEDQRANLLIGKQWLEDVRPALRAGDDDEARRRSVAFLRDNGLQQA